MPPVRNLSSFWISPALRSRSRLAWIFLMSSGTFSGTLAAKMTICPLPSRLLPAAKAVPPLLKRTSNTRPRISGNLRSRLALSPITRLVWRKMRKSCGAPSAPPTRMCSWLGWRSMAAMPPLSALGVIEVMLSMKRESANTVSFAVMSRPTEMMCFPPTSKAVLSTQSVWAPW